MFIHSSGYIGSWVWQAGSLFDLCPGIRDLQLWHVGSSSLTWALNWLPQHRECSLSHWTTREVPVVFPDAKFALNLACGRSFKLVPVSFKNLILKIEYTKGHGLTKYEKRNSDPQPAAGCPGKPIPLSLITSPSSQPAVKSQLEEVRLLSQVTIQEGK